MEVRNSALRGTPWAERTPSDLGASPSCARPYTMREVEKIPEFADEVAEVSTTTFTTCAAMPIPARFMTMSKASPGR